MSVRTYKNVRSALEELLKVNTPNWSDVYSSNYYDDEEYKRLSANEEFKEENYSLAKNIAELLGMSDLVKNL